MIKLRQKILTEGKILNERILDLSAFLNHQIDPQLMYEMGEEFAHRFSGHRITKVLTVEVSGVAPALMTGYRLGVPVVFARKLKPVTFQGLIYSRTITSPTKGNRVEISVKANLIGSGDSLLIIDDFLASGLTLRALLEIAQEAGAQVVGIGAVVEKPFQGGREILADTGIPIESLVKISGMRDGRIVFGY